MSKNVVIECRIVAPGCEDRHLRYAIGAEQAATLTLGPQPPPLLHWEYMDFRMRCDRADQLARAIGVDIAFMLVNALRRGTP